MSVLHALIVMLYALIFMLHVLIPMYRAKDYILNHHLDHGERINFHLMGTKHQMIVLQLSINVKPDLYYIKTWIIVYPKNWIRHANPKIHHN